jgi:hypothetical protein
MPSLISTRKFKFAAVVSAPDCEHFLIFAKFLGHSHACIKPWSNPVLVRILSRRVFTALSLLAALLALAPQDAVADGPSMLRESATLIPA